MPFHRREFLALAAGGAALAVSGAARALAAVKIETEVVAFDAFALFDLRPVFALATKMFPENGQALAALWRDKESEYCWLRGLSDRYIDFRNVSEQALIYAARSLKLDLRDDHRKQLMDGYLHLKLWPDALQSITLLNDMQLQIVLLSNMTESMLAANLNGAGIADVIDDVISTSAKKTYKPDPRAYRMVMERCDVVRGQVVYVPIAGWDAAGAKWFGYPTYWANRLNTPSEKLDVVADVAYGDLSKLADFIEP
ncbi:MAG: haloacid dehalogenase type II [Pseudomonadota bacterium]|nr:haloacid dehalogenase type II [Pseudomonadota bacterium]